MSGDRLSESTGQRLESRDQLLRSSRKGDRILARRENRYRSLEEHDLTEDQAPLLSSGELTTPSTTARDYINAFCNFMMRCCGSSEKTSDALPLQRFQPSTLVVEQPRPINLLPNVEATGTTHSEESQSLVDSHLAQPRADTSSSSSLIGEQPERIDPRPNVEATGATHSEESQSPVDFHPAQPGADISPVGHSTKAELTRRSPSELEEAGLETNKQVDAPSFTTPSTGIESKDQLFQDQFRVVLQEKNLSVSLTDQLDRRTPIREIWKKHGKEVAQAFAIARGKAKRQIIEKESLLYQKKDKDISEYFLKHSVPSESETNYDENVITVSNIFSQGSDSYACINVVSIDTGEFSAISNFNDHRKTKSNLSDIKFYQISRALKYKDKTFKDFNLKRVIGKFILNDEVKDTMRLFMDKDGQPFEDGSDGFEAYVGTHVGESNMRLTAEHPKAFKSRKLMSITMNIEHSETICTFGYQERDVSGESSGQ